MKILLICNYQREIPPFMITIVKHAENFYDKIEYINPALYNDNTSAIVSDKVAFRSISRKRTFHLLFGAFLGLFRKEIRGDIRKAIRDKKIKKDFFIHLAGEVYPSEVIYQEIHRILKTEYKDDKVSILAAWFNCNAYTVARIKRKFPSITAASFAHAFEVNPERSEFINLSLNDFKHSNLDRITFISQKVLNSYKALMGYSKENFLNKIDVCYLGSVNRDNYICQYGGNTLHILSCSGLSILKRVDLIMDALETWTDYPIEWTHIGAGDLYDYLRERAQKVCAQNPKVKIHFLGKFDNQKVHSYYRENPVDIFINVSISEGVPVSVMEAISYGVPVIATDVGGTSEIVFPPCNGFLLKPDLNYKDIQNTLKKYIGMSVEQKECMRKQSIEIWREKFDSDVNLPNYFRKLVTMAEIESKDK